MQFEEELILNSGITRPRMGSLTIVLKNCDDVVGVVREYIGATLAQHLGFNTPPFFLLWQDGQPLFASTFIPGARYDHDLITRQPFRSYVLDFDHFIGNPDRHGGNFLVADDVIYLIDHERAFQPGFDEAGECWTGFDEPAEWIRQHVTNIAPSLWVRFEQEFRHSQDALKEISLLKESFNRVV